MSTAGRTLKIFVMGQTSNSLRTVEIVNWTGLAFLGERQHVSSIQGREELSEPGVYLLLSESTEAGGLIDIYIGETDAFKKRISDHSQNKDWWDRFIVFVSKDKNLTKAHVKFLEREIHSLAQRSIANLRVMNSNEPGGSSLPESDESSMQEFLGNILFVLETLGLSYFSLDATESKSVSSNPPLQHESLEGMEFHITLPRETGQAGKIPKAFMRVQNGIIILKAGSFLRKTPPDSFNNTGYFGLWKQVTESDAVKPSQFSELLQTTRNIEFRAPSAAATVVRGRATNGRTEWKRVSDDEPLIKCQGELL
jgi:hypothetical protein